MRIAGAGVIATALFAAMAMGAAAQDGSGSGEVPALDGQSVSEMVMTAWATGTDQDIEAIYDPEVVMILDEDVLAADRDGIAAVIRGAIGGGNTYAQVGPVIEYRHSDGDTFIATLLEVHGDFHPLGDPVVGFYRVRDGQVTRHVFMDAEHY